nr:PKD domain-containing protein [uncultured Flavobacterium sp.]
MRIITLLLLIFQCAFAQQTKKALFIGNSYTYVNDLPFLVASMAQSTGNTLTYDSNTIGGYTLQLHSNNATTLNKIQQGIWDFVVLQEQSQLPSFPISDVQTMVYPYAQSLNSTILQYNPCAETVFYMTWGRENGDTENCAENPDVCTYQGMDNLLRERYMTMANSNQAIVSPAGAVWRSLRTTNPELNLYSGDQSHPSLLGSYAAACAFYTVLYRLDPTLITYNASLSINDATLIKNTVKSVVYNNLPQWYVGNYDPSANFTINQTNGLTYQFQNSSTNAVSYLWDFGDGTTSTEQNPTHTYAMNGNYNVTLTVSKCGISNEKVILLNTLSNGEWTVTNEDITIYPNPVANQLNLNSKNPIDKIDIYDSLFQKVKSENNVTDKSIDVSYLSSGVYFLMIKTDTKDHFVKLVKE